MTFTVDDLTRPRGNTRSIRDAAATTLMTSSVVLVMVPLALVLTYVAQRGSALFGWSFLTSDIPTTRSAGGGMGPAVAGTLLLTGTATLISVPLGVMGGIYLNEYGRESRAARILRMLADVMTGVPSIVMGLFIYTFLVLRTQSLSGFAGALALAALMLPVVIRATEEMLKLVPDDLRLGSFALGSRRATTILRVVLPAALPGIISGALLALARAAGETAPLLFVIGITSTSNWSLSGTNTALSVQIFRNATQPFEGAQQRAWAAALTLILIAFTFTLMARLLSNFLTRQSGAT